MHAMRLMPASDDKTQFNIYISRAARNRLESLAKQFDMGRATKVAAEIVENYMEHWAIAEQAKRRLIARQREAIERGIDVDVLKLPTAGRAPREQRSQTKRRNR